jgi:ATP-dependent DNA helicase RecQ
MATRRQSARRVHRLVRETLGFERLRPGQEAAMRAVLDGRDTLVVMPTGAGKSAIYQLAATQLPGPSVIVSPLIALQKDQVEALDGQELGLAAQLNATLANGRRTAVLEQIRSGALEFIFLAPEQLASDEVIAALRAARPSLFVVDEAHCISEWGHDFRPAYCELGAKARALGEPVILALTATASPLVREEIVARLGMRDPMLVVQGFDRPNIWFAVERYQGERAKRAALIEAVLESPPPGIVYVATRRQADSLASALCERGVLAARYHAGAPAKERAAVQDAFMADELSVIVATTAFGMGIDKPNIRWVYHYAPSASVDAYYQEVGRSGRDGEPAEAILFYDPADLGLRRFFAAGGGDERRKQFERSRVEMMRGYAEARDCRREYLLTYFGEPFDGPCGLCDNCDAGIGVPRDASREPFAVGGRVAHREWGAGQVVRYEDEKLVVLFDEVGYKALALDLVLERGLLARLD